MTMTDPIADLLTRIRNGLLARHREVRIPASRIKESVLRILKEEGFIEDVTREPGVGAGTLVVQLKYGPEGERIITGLERVSRPGRRVYLGSKAIPPVLDGVGINIVSTSQGLRTGAQCRRQGIGGEILCNVW